MKIPTAPTTPSLRCLAIRGAALWALLAACGRGEPPADTAPPAPAEAERPVPLPPPRAAGPTPLPGIELVRVPPPPASLAPPCPPAATPVHTTGIAPDVAAAWSVLRTAVVAQQGRRMPWSTALETYTARFWAHGGPEAGGIRLTPGFIPGQLARTMQLAVQQGAAFDYSHVDVPLDADDMGRIEALLRRVRPVIFGPETAAAPQREADTAHRPTDSAAAEIRTGDAACAPSSRSAATWAVPDPQQTSSVVTPLIAAGPQVDRAIRAVGGVKSTARWQAPAVQVGWWLQTRDLCPHVLPPAAWESGPVGYTPDAVMYWRNVAQALCEAGECAAKSALLGPNLRGQWRGARLRAGAVRFALRHLWGTETDTQPAASARRLAEEQAFVTALRAHTGPLWAIADPASPLASVFDPAFRTVLVADYVVGVWAVLGRGRDDSALLASPEMAAHMTVLRTLVDAGAVSVARSPTGLALTEVRLPAVAAALRPVLAAVRRIRFVGNTAAARELRRTARPPAGWRRALQNALRSWSADYLPVPLICRKAKTGAAWVSAPSWSALFRTW